MNRHRYTVDEIKSAATGREVEILEHVAGIPADVLDGLNHPCPKCGGQDRFRMIDRDRGAVYCNQCFYKKCGDFIAAVMWMNDCSFPQALERIGQYLGLSRY